MATDGNLRTLKKTFPFSTISFRLDMEIFVPLYLPFDSIPTSRKKEENTQRQIPFPLYQPKFLSLSSAQFFFFSVIAPRCFLMHLQCTYQPTTTNTPSTISLREREREREREDSRNDLNEGPKLSTTLRVFFLSCCLKTIYNVCAAVRLRKRESHKVTCVPGHNRKLCVPLMRCACASKSAGQFLSKNCGMLWAYPHTFSLLFVLH